jgi:hypothetical protein
MGHLGRFLCQTAPRPRTDTPERPHHITLTLCSPTQIRKHCSWGSGPLSNGGGRPSHCGTSVYHIGTHQHMFSIREKSWTSDYLGNIPHMRNKTHHHQVKTIPFHLYQQALQQCSCGHANLGSLFSYYA